MSESKQYVACQYHGGPYDQTIWAPALGPDGAPPERATVPDEERRGPERHVYERVPAVDGGWSYMYVGYMVA